MKQPRGRQAASVVRSPNDYDEYDRAWWERHVHRCLLGRINDQPGHRKMTASGIVQDLDSDPSILEKPTIKPFSKREDEEIWHQLHDPKPRKPSITQHITRVLPVLDENGPTVAVPWYEREFYEDYTTQPMEPVLK